MTKFATIIVVDNETKFVAPVSYGLRLSILCFVKFQQQKNLVSLLSRGLLLSGSPFFWWGRGGTLLLGLVSSYKVFTFLSGSHYFWGFATSGEGSRYFQGVATFKGGGGGPFGRLLHSELYDMQWILTFEGEAVHHLPETNHLKISAEKKKKMKKKQDRQEIACILYAIVHYWVDRNSWKKKLNTLDSLVHVLIYIRIKCCWN